MRADTERVVLNHRGLFTEVWAKMASNILSQTPIDVYADTCVIVSSLNCYRLVCEIRQVGGSDEWTVCLSLRTICISDTENEKTIFHICIGLHLG